MRNLGSDYNTELLSQHQDQYPSPVIRLAQPSIGSEEVEAITAVLQSGILTNGPQTAAFEQEFADYHEVEHGVAFANGTLALIALYTALGIGPGDEVILPALTFISSATSVSLVGATPVFADVEFDTYNIDPEDVAQRVSPRTKAILAVHYGGQPASMADLKRIALKYGLVLIEDAAEAHGATFEGKHVGGFGAAAMFSFTPTKNITTGEGGVITTHDASLAHHLRLLRNHGQTDLYRHELLGWNMRITEMQAGMGRCQLRKLDSILTKKRLLAKRMNDKIAGLEGVIPPLVRQDRDHVYMLYTVRVSKHRDRILHEMRRRGIEARIYFPPVHRQAIYLDRGETLPVTDSLSAEILSLPLHAAMTTHDVDWVGKELAKAVNAKEVK